MKEIHYDPREEVPIEAKVMQAVGAYNTSLEYEGTGLRHLLAHPNDVVDVSFLCNGTQTRSYWLVGEESAMPLFERPEVIESRGSQKITIAGHLKNGRAVDIIEKASHPNRFLERFGLVKQVTEEAA